MDAKATITKGPTAQIVTVPKYSISELDKLGKILGELRAVAVLTDPTADHTLNEKVYNLITDGLPTVKHPYIMNFVNDINAVLWILRLKLPNYMWQLKHGFGYEAVVWSLGIDYDEKNAPAGFHETIPARAFLAAVLTAIFSDRRD